MRCDIHFRMLGAAQTHKQLEKLSSTKCAVKACACVISSGPNEGKLDLGSRDSFGFFFAWLHLDNSLDEHTSADLWVGCVTLGKHVDISRLNHGKVVVQQLLAVFYVFIIC